MALYQSETFRTLLHKKLPQALPVDTCFSECDLFSVSQQHVKGSDNINRLILCVFAFREVLIQLSSDMTYWNPHKMTCTHAYTHTHTRLKRMLFNLTKNPISSTSKNLISSYQPDLLCVNVCVVCVCVCGLRGREKEGKRVCAIDVTVCRCIDVKLCRVREKHLCNYFVTPSTLLFHDLVKQLELFRIGF